jgi:hypothetical protein
VAVHTKILPTPTDTRYRLGRHKKHDDASWEHRIELPRRRADVTTVWTYSKPVLNQWNTNACTGNFMAHLLNTDFMEPVRKAKGVDWLTEKDALNFYSIATHEEDDPNYYYPPNDQGSDGLDVSKAAVQLGWSDRYQHAFGFDDFRAALQTQPVGVGTIWTNDMFDVDANYVMHPGSLDDSNVAGGHQYLALEIHYNVRLIWFLTSWGADFARRGMFALSFDDFEALLAQEGDVVVPHGVGLP